MRRVLFAALVGASLSEAWNWTSEADARRRLAENQQTLVAFVEPRLETGRLLETEWKLVETALPDAISIDCSEAKSLCFEHDVISYPAIRLYQTKPNVPMIRYRGARRAKDIEAFVARINRDVVSTIQIHDADSFASLDDIVIVASMPNSNIGFLSLFTDFAHEYRDRYSFAVMEADSTSVTCTNKIDLTQHSTAEIENVNALREILRTCTEPLIPALTRRNEMNYMSGGKSLVYYFTESDDDRDDYVDKMRELARSYREYLALVTVDSREYPHMPASLGVAAKGGLAVQNPHTGEVFPFRGKLVNTESISNFIMSISEGKVEAWDGQASTDRVSRDEL